MAERDFPTGEEYEGYPQLQNGVGMARKFLDEALEVHNKEVTEPLAGCGVLTGIAGAVIIRKIMEIVQDNQTELVVVENKLLGSSVTVTSLLSGSDIISGLKGCPPSSKVLLIRKPCCGREIFSMTSI